MSTVIEQLAEKAGVTTSPDVDLDVAPVDAIVSPNSIYDHKLKAIYDAEPKKRVYIPTPETWKQPFPYAERIQINGIIYIIMADQDVLLPESVAAVWENKRNMDRATMQQQRQMESLMTYTNINQVPHWYR